MTINLPKSLISMNSILSTVEESKQIKKIINNTEINNDIFQIINV